MKYFIDTEFVEGTQSTFWGNTKPTIDLISIGIVAEDGRQYYAISKDFNLKEAWNRYDCNINVITKKEGPRTYWIRDNVLKPIYLELLEKELGYGYSRHEFYKSTAFKIEDKDYKQFKYLINKYGKTNKQIAEEIKDFVSHKHTNLLINHLNFSSKIEWSFENRMDIIDKKYPHYLPQLYGYYSDYDHVALCWLFGKMIDLPEGFPKYCKDLKQIFDEKKSLIKGRMKDQIGFPVNNNIHNALEDAKWNYNLYKFLENLHE